MVPTVSGSGIIQWGVPVVLERVGSYLDSLMTGVQGSGNDVSDVCDSTSFRTVNVVPPFVIPVHWDRDVLKRCTGPSLLGLHFSHPQSKGFSVTRVVHPMVVDVYCTGSVPHDSGRMSHG